MRFTLDIHSFIIKIHSQHWCCTENKKTHRRFRIDASLKEASNKFYLECIHTAEVFRFCRSVVVFFFIPSSSSLQGCAVLRRPTLRLSFIRCTHFSPFRAIYVILGAVVVAVGFVLASRFSNVRSRCLHFWASISNASIGIGIIVVFANAIRKFNVTWLVLCFIIPSISLTHTHSECVCAFRFIRFNFYVCLSLGECMSLVHSLHVKLASKAVIWYQLTNITQNTDQHNIAFFSSFHSGFGVSKYKKVCPK